MKIWGFQILTLVWALLLAGAAPYPSARACVSEVVEVGEGEVPVTRPLRSTRAWIVIPEEKLAQYGALYALSDVHGEYEDLVSLLESAGVVDEDEDWAAGNALLIVAGDMINKGARSAEVVRLFMRLQKQAAAKGGRVVVLLGNHEAKLLAAPAEGTPEFEASFGLAGLGAKERKEAVEFLEGLPIGVFAGNAFFCHSGFLTRKTFRKSAAALREGDYTGKGLMGKSSILDAKGWQNDPEKLLKIRRAAADLGITVMGFGHQQYALGRGGITRSSDGFFIQLDADWVNMDTVQMLKAANALDFSRRGAAAAVRVTHKGNEKPLHEEQARPAAPSPDIIGQWPQPPSASTNSTPEI